MLLTSSPISGFCVFLLYIHRIIQYFFASRLNIILENLNIILCSCNSFYSLIAASVLLTFGFNVCVCVCVEGGTLLCIVGCLEALSSLINYYNQKYHKTTMYVPFYSWALGWFPVWPWYQQYCLPTRPSVVSMFICLAAFLLSSWNGWTGGRNGIMGPVCQSGCANLHLHQESCLRAPGVPHPHQPSCTLR